MPQLPGLLEGFTGLIAGDATVVQVHKSLAAKWKGTGSDAAIKVHTLVRASRISTCHGIVGRTVCCG